MYCKSCGKQIDEDSAFCRYCGAQQAQPPAVSPAPPVEVIPQRRVYTLPAGGAAPRTIDAPPRPSRRGLFFFLGLLTLLIVGVVVVMGLGGPKVLGTISTPSYTAPSYVKQVTAYKEGSKAFQIYFVLADASGAQTAADGYVTLTISQEHTDFSTNRKTETTLYTTSFSVKAWDFQKTTVGQGSFGHELLLCSIGRVPYSNFHYQPTEFSGTVSVQFAPDRGGGTMEGHDTVLFDK